MASQSEVTTSISAVLSAAESQALTSAQMLAIVRRGIATAIAIGGTSVVSMEVGSEKYQIDLEVARRLEAQYRKWSQEETGMGGFGFGKLQGRMP